MLTLVSQPSNLCPNPKSRPVDWIIQTDEHITNPGAFAVFQVQIDTPGGPNGDTLIIAGETFTTDDTQLFTFSSFDPNGTSEQVANNLANAVRANSLFQGYQVFLTSGGGGIWVVNGFSFDLETKPNWVFDNTGLSVLVVSFPTTQNGSTPVIANMRLWYRLYDDQLPLMKKERYSSLPFRTDFTFYTEVRVRLNELVRALVSSTMPPYTINIAFEDTTYQKQITLRFGLVSNDINCNEVRTLADVSQPIIVVNSVHQLDDLRAFQRHCPNFQTGVRFLTDRPPNMNLCRGVYEWLHIWIENNGIFIGNFRAEFSFFDSGGGAIGEQTLAITEPDKAWIVPIHTNLPIFPANAARFTMVIQGEALDNDEVTVIWQDYSEQIERTIVDCHCIAAEVYFLEDHGGFRTVTFKKKVSESIEMEESTYQLPIDWADIQNRQYYIHGGTYSVAEQANTVFILRTEKLITSADRTKYEQLLRSPEVYIRTKNQLGLDIQRRIIFPKGAYQTFTSGNGALKIDIPFRFANELRVH